MGIVRVDGEVFSAKIFVNRQQIKMWHLQVTPKLIQFVVHKSILVL
jgi:hypothetical protein